MQAGPSSSAAHQVLPDGPEPVVFEVEYTPTEQLEPLEDAEAQSKVRSLRCQRQALCDLQRLLDALRLRLHLARAEQGSQPGAPAHCGAF